MKDTDLVGLIPCAGSATRLGLLPFSKELYPIGFDKFLGVHCLRVVSSHLIEHMMDAGVKNFHLILTEEKKDIPTYFNNFKQSNINFKYHIAQVDYGVPFSLNTAYRFIKDKTVCLGFPDILFKPKKVFNRLLDKLNSSTEIDIVLGVMNVERPEKADLIEYDSENKIKRIVIKSKTEKNLKYGWICAVWNSSFTEYLNTYILNLTASKSPENLKNNEIYIGDIIREAINSNFIVESVVFENGTYLDIGTPEDLKLADTFFDIRT